MTPAAAKSELHCPQCGAAMARGVDGLCGACLLRLAAAAPNPGVGWEKEAAALSACDARKLEGQRVGRYLVRQQIAQRETGVVYRAREIDTGRAVALKILLPRLLPLPGALARLREDLGAVSLLDHPGILPLLAVSEHAGLPCFSMQLADGGSLDQRMERLRGRGNAVASLLGKVAQALEHAHRNGVLHLGLTPANILFVDEEPRLADFGLERFRALHGGFAAPAGARGASHYAAPEQIAAQPQKLGPATDIYALGAILYELLMRKPHAAQTDAIALRCLSPDPRDRYASAGELAAALREACG